MSEKNENFYYEEDEISLYDIIDILSKYKKLIISILVVGFILSFGLALGLRNYKRKEIAKQNYILNYASLEANEYYQMIGLHYIKFTPQIMLQNEKYIDKFLEIPELKERFEKINIENDNLISSKKIEFISKIIKVEHKDGIHSITVTTDKALNISNEIIEIYFKILEEEIPNKIKILIKEEKKKAEILNNEVTNKLKDIKIRITEILNNEKSTNLTADNMYTFFSFKDPLLATDNSFYQSIYSTTSKQILGAENILNSSLIDGIIEKISPVIISDKNGIAKFILLGGLVFTFFLIFMIIMFKEFKEGYRKHKNEKIGQKKLAQ